MIVDQIPRNSEYIGKIKIVPSDFSNSFNKDSALNSLKKNGCKYGARYIYILNMESSGSDFMNTHLDRTFGDGYTIEAELYR